jgi:hypothetical protein
MYGFSSGRVRVALGLLRVTGAAGAVLACGLVCGTYAAAFWIGCVVHPKIACHKTVPGPEFFGLRMLGLPASGGAGGLGDLRWASRPFYWL